MCFSVKFAEFFMAAFFNGTRPVANSGILILFQSQIEELIQYHLS